MSVGSTRSRGGSQAVIDLVVRILDRRQDDVVVVYQKPGGWESWLQGELFIAMTKEMSLIPMAETKVYGTAERADFSFITTEGTDLAIELKCEGLHNQIAFPGEVAKDTLKMGKFQGPGWAIQIAVSCNQTDQVRLDKSERVGKFTVHWTILEA